MKRLVLAALVLAALLVGACPGRAAPTDDKVTYRDSATKKDVDISGTITKEGPAGVTIKTTREQKTIPALQIQQIVYQSTVGPLTFRGPDGTLTRALGAAPRSKTRASLLDKALVDFKDLDEKEKGSDRIHAYLQYRIAQIAVIRAQDDPKKIDDAIAALKAFKKDFGTSWEIVPALKTLAQLQEGKGDAEGASETYAALIDLPGAPEEMKRQGQMLVVKMLLRGRKFADAERRLQDIERSSTQNDPQHAFVQVYLAQSRIAQGNTAGAAEQLKKAIEASSDSDLRAVAHNALGDYYRQQKKLDAAFWEYLKVDALYNQDREEYARALYNLAELHDKVNNDPIRAEECRTRLQSSEFAGTYYQRLLAEKKSASASP
jgi:predicted negative regulator of RcsB-dependent stress response